MIWKKKNSKKIEKKKVEKIKKRQEDENHEETNTHTTQGGRGARGARGNPRGAPRGARGRGRGTTTEIEEPNPDQQAELNVIEQMKIGDLLSRKTLIRQDTLKAKKDAKEKIKNN